MSSSQFNISLPDGVIRFDVGAKCLSTFVKDVVINSVVSGPAKDKLLRWKRKVASTVMKERGRKWNPSDRYAITLQFRFHHSNHGWRKDDRGETVLDVENFIKPVLDAVAAGLFTDRDPYEINHFNEDDTGFRTLLIHRQDDPDDPSDEGVRIFVSAIKQP